MTKTIHFSLELYFFQQIDATVNTFARDYFKSRDLLGELQSNLVALPDVLSKVEIAQRRIGILLLLVNIIFLVIYGK